MAGSIASGIARSMPVMIAMRMAFRAVVNEVKDVYTNIDSIPGVSPDVIESIHQMKYALEDSNSGLKQGIAQMEAWAYQSAAGWGYMAAAAVYGMDTAKEAAAGVRDEAEKYNDRQFAAEFEKEAKQMDRLRESTGAYANSLMAAAASKWHDSESAPTVGESHADALAAMHEETEAQHELDALNTKLAESYKRLGVEQGKVLAVGHDHVLTLDQLKDREGELMHDLGNLGAINEQDGVQTEKRIDLNNKLADTYRRMAQEMAKIKDPMEEVRQTFTRAFEGASDVIATFVTTGKAKFSDFFLSLEKQIISTLIKLELINPILNRMFSGTAGYQTQAAFSTGTAVIGAIAGFLATGGPAQGGQPYVVGEDGPELFVPNGNGTVVPNGGRASASGGNGGPNIVYNITSGVQRNDLVPILDAHSKRIKSEIYQAKRHGGAPSQAMG